MSCLTCCRRKRRRSDAIAFRWRRAVGRRRLFERVADCEYELPIAAEITAGNVHDQAVASNVLSEARTVYPKFRP